MKEIFLSNTGTSLVPLNEEGEDALRGYPVGVTLRVKITQPRSLPHHNFFFAFLAEAFENWPSDLHRFQPRDPEHLRAWLTTEAGFKEVFESDLMPEFRYAAMAANIMSVLIKRFTKGRPIRFRIEGSKLIAEWPVSIKFTEMDEEEFKRFTRIVFTLIYSETGIDVEDYYREWSKRNGVLKVVPTRNKTPVENGLYFS